MDIVFFIKIVIDLVVILGDVNFGINMWRCDNIKLELNVDYKYLCLLIVLFMDFLFGDDLDLFK